MKDVDKTRKQLIQELEELRRQVAELEQAESERQQAEEALRKSERELSIMNRIAEIFLGVPDDEMYGEVLQVVLEAMESPYGTFAYIDEHGNRVVPSMTRDIWEQCRISEKDIVFPREKWRGIWGRCLVGKKALSSNGPFNVPDGHIPIARALAVPITHQGEVLGNFLVGNKTADYDENDLKLLEAIADQTAPILHARLQREKEENQRKRAERELKWESGLNAVLSELYKPLISPSSSIEEMAARILERAQHLTGSADGYVSSIDPSTGDNVGHTLTEMMGDQCRVSSESDRIAFPRGDDGSYGSLWGYSLNTLTPFFTNSPRTHPASTGIPEGHIPLRNFLSVPVLLGEEPVGQIALANKEEDYTERDLESIRRLAEFFALAIQRKRGEEALQEAHDQLELRVQERTKELKTANQRMRMEIEERRRGEEEIRRSKAMLQSVFDGISEPLVMLDKALSVKMLNEAALEYYHVADFEGVVGIPCYLAFKGESSPCDGCSVPESLAKGRQVVTERRGLFDPKRFEEVVVYPVEEVPGEMTACVLRVSDVTKQKTTEKQLIRADRLSSLGQLSGGIAHEIRNPLSGISLYVDILRDEEQFERTEKEQEIFAEIRRNINGIDGIIRRVLDFAKESDAIFTEIDVNYLIHQNLKLWHTKMRNEEIRLELSLQEDLCTIDGDIIGIQQVINNLIQNAVESMSDGGILSISTENGESALYESRSVVIIKVQDTGPGIALEDQEKIFNPFFTTKPTGTGLGLSISHQIIERHGGIISLESQPDKQTTFKIELPVAQKR